MPDFDWKGFIGGGAFGNVWHMFDKAVDEDRAVKMFAQTSVIDPTNFYAEAHALSALQHDNIVSVKDAGSLPPSTVYVAMEYLPDGSVEGRLEAGTLTIRDSVRLAADACRGLEYAHHKGYIHRDIKPANILIGKNGEGKLGDFGIAARITPFTKPGGMGYRTHCAPEMLVSDTSSVLSDIYAMGVTLYRMVNKLTSRDFDALAPSDVDRAIIAGKFPPRDRYNWDVPRALRTLINKAMNVDAAKRYQSADALRHALEQQSILCDWNEQLSAAEDVYTAHDTFTVELTVKASKSGKWVVTARRGMAGQSVRGVSAASKAFETRESARKYARDLALGVTVAGPKALP